MSSKPTEPKLPTGIMRRHSRQCATTTGGKCNCTPTYKAWVYDRRTGGREYQTHATLAAAKQWRNTAAAQLARAPRKPPSRQTVKEAVDEWIAGATAEPPTVLNRSEQPYKPSALREVERNLRKYIVEEFGAQRISDIARGDLTAYVERLRARGLSGSKIRNIINALRVVYRRELALDRVAEDPTMRLRLPNGHTPRERAATAPEAKELLDALPIEVRPIYAAACYAGLRRGELQALRWDDVDLPGNLIHVSRAWDEVAGEIPPKSKNAIRDVPIVALLSDHLTDLKARTDRSGRDFVFGRTATEPFTPSHVTKQAADAWTAANEKRAKKKLPALLPIGLHELRHTFVSLLYDAGLSLEQIGDLVGHAGSYMTAKYRHLLEGHADRHRTVIDAYLERADTAARLDQLES